MYWQLEPFRVPPEFETTPTAACACPTERQNAHAQPSSCLPDRWPPHAVKVPRLLRTYLAFGTRSAARPAWDREFGAIDFLTLLDLDLLAPSARSRFLAPFPQ